MIIQPRTRGFICLTAHPDGALQAVKNQIEYVKSKGKIKNGQKKFWSSALLQVLACLPGLLLRLGQMLQLSAFSLKSQHLKVKWELQDGIILPLLKKKPTLPVYTQKVLMAMHFLTISKGKPLI